MRNEPNGALQTFHFVTPYGGNLLRIQRLPEGHNQMNSSQCVIVFEELSLSLLALQHRHEPMGSVVAVLLMFKFKGSCTL